jgi:poly-gamma-glutamate synthesis protein (capsule biosynthesis protein)
MRQVQPRRGSGLIRFLLVAAAVLNVAGCVAQSELPVPWLPAAGTPSATPFQPIPWTPSPSPLPSTLTPTPPPYSLWVDPALPKNFTNQIELPPGIGLAENAQGATWKLDVSDSQTSSQWIYALVAPFPTLVDGVSAKEIARAWDGKQVDGFEGAPLFMDEDTRIMLASLWGEPAKGAVKIIKAQNLEEQAWNKQPSWAVIPFEALTPRWKVLTIDGISPIQKHFDPQEYTLTVPISLTGNAPVKPGIPLGNRDPEKLTVLVMTGVTALVRATAFTMERQGILYPARDIGGWLREADITHISNEVPFAEDCPAPNPVQQGMVFCSDDDYIELLEHVGTDIIELTGDHFSDWGSEAMLHTLDLYDARSWQYYGGGANLNKGKQAVILSHNGNQLAFIGCNAKGGAYARAGADNPGAARCDFDWMVSEIERLRQSGSLPIATFQHIEYYTYTAQPNQVRDAHTLTKAGAVIVSGSQAHHPQAIEFSHGSFVHHGLGNLFFDQLDVSTGTRQAFIDRHIFYGGRHISTELLTIWFEDYARARPMRADERLSLLRAIFQASGWDH